MIPGLHEDPLVWHEGRLVYADSYISAQEGGILATGQIPCPVPHTYLFVENSQCGRCGAAV